MKKYIIIAIAALAALTACDKEFLTEAPKLSQSDVLTLSTFQGLDMSTAGAYSPMGSTNWYGAHFILDNEMATGNGKRWGIIFDDYESGRYTDQYAVNYTPNSTSPLWGQAYYVISAANNVLNAIEDNGIDSYISTSVSKQDIENLRAECLFLRAFSHFDLVRTYSMPYSSATAATAWGVPYIKVSDSEAQPPRETMENTYKYIIDDLLEAESVIDPDYVRAGAKDSRSTVTLEVIQAMLARVYLYSQQWQKAGDYADKVITSGKYTMWTPADLKNAACYRVDVPTGGEVIFEIYNNTSQSYGTGNENVWGMTSYEAYGDCGVSTDLTNLFEENDVRATLYSPDPDGNALFTLKYFGKGLGALDANNVIILRLSEMYLIRAEAAINGAKGDYSATSDLKTIADNRGATAQPATQTGVNDERAKELAWEAHLWFDLARTGRPMTRTDIAGNVPTTIPVGDYRWAKPIPNREFTVNHNDNFVQNDGYGE
ncbi:MAG: RagB/SusD family nutrient uptake outer membrane protein [Bacteroidales bacterium]|nr:RagB/SusD family nutrient uptake outer membrane protein [Bacteroidales bacterium]